MKKLALIIIFLSSSTLMQAHQPDISTTMLVQQDNKTWVLQVSGSLTAFQTEIRKQFANTPYKTPEEFQEMVLEHMKNKINITINNQNAEVKLTHGIVKLGHETKVVFQVMGVPDDIKQIEVSNTAFSDINRSQSALVLLKSGFNKEHFVLNKSNNFSIKLKTEGNTFVKQIDNQASFLSTKILLGLFLTALIVFLIQKIKSKKHIPVPVQDAVLSIVRD
jgi:hypothetical protein